jgi:hypothetical protein
MIRTRKKTRRASPCPDLANLSDFIPRGMGPGGRIKSITPEMRQQVALMAATGVRHIDMAAIFSISLSALTKHFRQELDVAPIRANVRVAQNLYRQATRDDPKSIPAAVAWLKARGGWGDTVKHEVSGEIMVETQEQRIKRLREVAMIDVTPK